MLTHKGTVTIITPRLTLRRAAAEDAQAMYENWAADKKSTAYLSWDAHSSPEETRALLEKWIASYADPEYYNWVIEYGGTIVGSIHFDNVHTVHERCEIGYCIGSKWWNKGIATEATGLVIRFAFEQMNAHKIYALYNTENIASGRIMEKNGMKREGLLREHYIMKDGRRGDMARYAILRGEWQ